MEVMIAISFLTISILYIYTNKAPTQTSLDEYIHNFHKEILSEIATNVTLRTMVLNEQEGGIMNTITLPQNLNYSVRICDLEHVAKACNMDGLLRAELENRDVLEIFVDETIVASNISHYDPKKVKLYIWQEPI